MTYSEAKIDSRTASTRTALREYRRKNCGRKYGEEQDNILKSNSLYTLTSDNARWLMQLANVERFAVDDCIILASSEDFKGTSN